MRQRISHWWYRIKCNHQKTVEGGSWEGDDLGSPMIPLYTEILCADPKCSKRLRMVKSKTFGGDFY